MNTYKFTKMSGAGNDFILFDKKNYPEFLLNPEKIRQLCDRHFGIGADGVILIGDTENMNFNMDYFNADGSHGSLCGNGARCAIKYADLSGRIEGDSVRFSCNNETFSGKTIDDGRITFFLNSPSRIKKNFKLKAHNQLLNASFADTGSPHVVVNIEDVVIDPNKPIQRYSDIDQLPVLELGREIRYHNDFAPEGTNVNFYKITADEILIRTYERGVENETLACGTGSVATAIIASMVHGITPPVKLHVKGGDILEVNFMEKSGEFIEVSLTGPAVPVFSGEINLSN